MEPAPLTLFHTLPALPRAHQTIHRSFSGLGVKAVKGSRSGPFQMIHLLARLPQWERISNAEAPRNQFCYLLTEESSLPSQHVINAIAKVGAAYIRNRNKW